MAQDDSDPATAEGMAGDGLHEATRRMQAAGTAAAEDGAQLGLKMLSQAEANMQEAFRAMRAAAQASDIAEVMRIQSDYLRDQGSRSMAQAREIAEMIAQLGRGSIGRMTSGD